MGKKLNATKPINRGKVYVYAIHNKNKTQKIILVENEEIISKNIQTTDVFNDYLVNIASDLIHSKHLRIQVS